MRIQMFFLWAAIIVTLYGFFFHVGDFKVDASVKHCPTCACEVSK